MNVKPATKTAIYELGPLLSRKWEGERYGIILDERRYYEGWSDWEQRAEEIVRRDAQVIAWRLGGARFSLEKFEGRYESGWKAVLDLDSLPCWYCEAKGPSGRTYFEVIDGAGTCPYCHRVVK